MGAETDEQTIPVVETTAEETPKVVEGVEEKEETNGHTENGNGTTEVRDVDETTEETNEIHKDADYENGEKVAENGHENGATKDDSNGHTENGAVKRKVEEEELAPLEPIPVSAEKIAKLTETTEEKEEVQEVEATS